MDCKSRRKTYIKAARLVSWSKVPFACGYPSNDPGRQYEIRISYPSVSPATDEMILDIEMVICWVSLVLLPKLLTEYENLHPCLSPLLLSIFFI